MRQRITVTHNSDPISRIEEMEGYLLDSISASIPLWRRPLIWLGFTSFTRYKVHLVYRKKDGPDGVENAER